MKRIGLYSLLFLLLNVAIHAQVQLRRSGFSNGAQLNASGATFQLKSGVNNSVALRAEAVQATGVVAGDSLALVALYNATNSGGWVDTTNWFVGPVSSWHGIKVTGDRVTSIDLSYNNLVGGLPLELGDLTALDSINFDTNKLTTVPSELTNVTGLVYLNLNRNELEFLPDLSSISSLQYLGILYNYLDFDDIVPNSGFPDVSSIQTIKNSGYDSSMVVGNPITLDLTGSVAGTGNVYQWSKDGTDIPGATSDSYTIASFTHADEGTYQLLVTNPSDLSGTPVRSLNYNLFINDVMYWIGDGGDWKDISHWSYTSGQVDPVAALPSRYDDVRFDSLSFTLPGQVVTILDDASTIGVEFKTMDWSGVQNTPTFQIRTTVSNWIYNYVDGSLIFDENMNIDFQGVEFYFRSTEDYVIDTKGHYLGDNCWIAVNYGAGSQPVTCNVLSDVEPAGMYLNQGRINLNGNSWTEKDSYVWVRGDSSVLDISGSKLDVSNIYLNASTVGASIISDSSTVKVHTALRVNNAPLDHVILADSANVQLYSHTFNTLEVEPGANVVLPSALTQVVNGNLILNGSSTLPINITASILDTAAVISKPSGQVDANFVTLKDNTATGGALFNVYNGTNNGNVTGWTFITNRVLFEQDSLALVALYNATDGANWTNNTGWLTGTPDTWNGISITDSRVTSISLGTNNLVGSVPSEIANLTQLENLQLHENSLTDTIPAALWELPLLGSVSLYTNQLTGTLPNNMGSHGNFSYLELAENAFSGSIPEGLSVNEGLTYLNLSHNQFDGAVPSSFTNLVGLQTLYLNNNNLVDLPDLSSLSAITILTLDDNFFTFEDLEANAGITGVSYSSMKNPRQSFDTLLNIGDSLFLPSNTGGNSNVYQWYKNGSPISTTSDYSVNAAQFTDEGQYYCDISNSLATLLTLRSDTFNIKVSSLERDQIALTNIYDAMGGANWTTASGWTTGDITTWDGITITNNRVTGWAMPTNNIAGSMPADINDLRQLITVDLQGNSIEDIPAITLPNITSFNVSQNKLDFGDLEPNVGVAGIVYSNQDSIATGGEIIVQADQDQFFEVNTAGTANSYQWFKDGAALSGAVTDTITIPTVRRAEMGDYYVEVSNSTVPGLTLTSRIQRLLAQTSVSGTVTLDGTNPMTSGEVSLLRITDTEGYDTTSIVNVAADGSYQHDNVLLDDYITIVQPDTIIHSRFLPTYFSQTIYWIEADTIFLDSLTNNINVLLDGFPAEAPNGDGKIYGVLEEEVPDGGRIEAKKRVGEAGVSVRRRAKQGRTEEDEYVLVDYVYTNAQGEFSLNHLEPDEYLLNIEYPGFPMNESSDIWITVGDGNDSQVQVSALVDNGNISVNIIEVTGIERAAAYSNVAFYPNPTSSILYFEGLPETHNYRVDILEVTGRKAMSTEMFNGSVDVSELNKGMYILQVFEMGKLSSAVISARLVIK